MLVLGEVEAILRQGTATNFYRLSAEITIMTKQVVNRKIKKEKSTYSTAKIMIKDVPEGKILFNVLITVE